MTGTVKNLFRNGAAAAALAGVVLLMPFPAHAETLESLRAVFDSERAAIRDDSSLSVADKSRKMGELRRSYDAAAGKHLRQIGQQIEALDQADAALRESAKLQAEKVEQQFKSDPEAMAREAREIARKYTEASRDLAAQKAAQTGRLLDEAAGKVNETLPPGQQKATSEIFRSTEGTDASTQGRGIRSDSEFATDARGQNALRDTFSKAGLVGETAVELPGVTEHGSVGADTVREPAATTYKKLNITVHDTGNMGVQGDSARSVQTSVNAASVETYSSAKMDAGTPGAQLVRTLDHANKAKAGMAMTPEEFYNNPDAMQGGAKGAMKCAQEVWGSKGADGTVRLTDAGRETVQGILKKNGLDSTFTPEKFMESLSILKGENADVISPSAAGVNPENIPNVQKAMSDIINHAQDTARAKANVDIPAEEARIAEMAASDGRQAAEAKAKLAAAKEAIKAYEKGSPKPATEPPPAKAAGTPAEEAPAAGAVPSAPKVTLNPAGQGLINALNETTQTGGRIVMVGGVAYMATDLYLTKDADERSYKAGKAAGNLAAGTAGGLAAGWVGTQVGTVVGGLIGGAVGFCLGGVGAAPCAAFGAEAGATITGLGFGLWGAITAGSAGERLAETQLVNPKSKYTPDAGRDLDAWRGHFLGALSRGNLTLRDGMSPDEAWDAVKSGATFGDVFMTRAEDAGARDLVRKANELEAGGTLPSDSAGGDWSRWLTERLSGQEGKLDGESRLRKAEVDSSGASGLADSAATPYGNMKNLFENWMDAYCGDVDERDKAASDYANRSGSAVLTERQVELERNTQAALDALARQGQSSDFALSSLTRSLDSLLAEQQWQRENSWGAWLQSVIMGSAGSVAQGFGTGFGTRYGSSLAEKWIGPKKEKPLPPDEKLTPPETPPESGKDHSDKHAPTPPKGKTAGTSSTTPAPPVSTSSGSSAGTTQTTSTGTTSSSGDSQAFKGFHCCASCGRSLSDNEFCYCKTNAH